MTEDTDSGGFLSRWSRRKVQVQRGAELAPAEAETNPPVPAVAPTTPVAPLAEAAPPAPTLADVAALGQDADYTRFVAAGVDGDVKNAALKKLFAEPHFNVMDGLDTYIDDYGKPDPMPAGMLRQMVQSKLLGLFDDEEQPGPDEVLPLPPTLSPPVPLTPPDENPDLRLQPHDDARRPGPEPGAGEDAGREH
jgi:hypothetical protein